MKIETKYSLGEVVWFMKDNKPQSGSIHEIKISVYDSPGDHYQTNRNIIVSNIVYGNLITFADTDPRVFLSKEALIASL